ncbi:MAG: orotate phosphoribosyltransferase [Planctomycetota bacterium]|nr:orotate phosphoribosyltransferase [Planctomycetota bacterium]
MDDETMKALAREIAAVSVLRGQFTLRSGRTSSYYLDKYLFSTRPEILRQLGQLFAERIPSGTDRLAGAELGGIPLVSAASIESGIPCIFIRNSKKEYGTSKQLEGALERGDRVVLLEDVATTGGQALEAVEIIRSSGAEVVKTIATIDRLEGARENFEAAGVEFESIFTRADLGVEG